MMKSLNWIGVVGCGVMMMFGGVVEGKGRAFDDPAKALKEDADFKFQGEYTGTIKEMGAAGGMKVGVLVVALGKGKFRLIPCDKGLPGDPGASVDLKVAVEGKLEGNMVRAKVGSENGTVEIHPDGTMVLSSTVGDFTGTLKKVVRKSPTLGAKPPKGAIVLFDGKGVEKWAKGKMTKSGLLTQGAQTKKRFGDHQLHIEFRLPYMPEARGQGRGNSGLYMQGRYEIQMLDSFGLEGKDNECGGVYKIAKPKVNMCYPPLSWQTYDVEFTAAKFDKNGKKIAKAKMTVRHNGVVIHKDLELPGKTGGSVLKSEKGPGPIYLQNHGNPVRYRNIWVLPTGGKK